MDLSGTYTFDADNEAVWNILMDPDAIANALPGVDKFDPVDGEDLSWNARMKISMAAINGNYGGTLRMSDVEPMTRYRLIVNGEGQQSIISGNAVIHLDYDETSQQTLLNWEAEANISGKLARVGQRVIKAAANMMSNRFFGSLAEQLSSQGQPEEQ